MSTDAEGPIRVVVTPSSSSCFAGESISVTITFTNTQTQPFQRNHPYSHKRNAHSVSAVPLARPPTAPGTPRTTVPLLPTRDSTDESPIARKGIVGREYVPRIQTNNMKKGRTMNRSLSLDISSPNGIEKSSSYSGETSSAKSSVYAQRALLGSGTTPTSPRVPSPLARSTSLPLSPRHPHARKMSVDVHVSQELSSPITPTGMTTSASNSSYSLSLDPISETLQSSPSVTPVASPAPTGTILDLPSRSNAKTRSSTRQPPLRPSNLRLDPNPLPSSENNFPRTAPGAPMSFAQVILYSYVQFIGSLFITPVAGTTDQTQELALNSLRSSLLKRSIIGGGSMDITASLDPSQRRTRSLMRHSRSSSFSSGLMSLLSSPSSLLPSSPKLPSSASQKWMPSHKSVSSMQASRSAPSLSTSSGSPVNNGFGQSFPSGVSEELVNPETPLPTYEVQPTMLAVDLALVPGESRSYTYTLTLPQNLPPTFKGRTFRFSYELLVGVCRAASTGSSASPNSSSRVMKVPIRVYNNVAVGKSPSPYDLLWPVIYARSPAYVAKPNVTEDTRKAKKIFSAPSPVSTQAGSMDAIREYAKRLLASVRDPDPSSLDVDSGREREAGGLTGCREAVEILSRNSKKMSYDIDKDGVQVAVLTFTKSAYRLGETVLCVVDLNERKGRSRVLKLSAMLESHESLPTTIAGQSGSRMLRKTHAECHCSLVASTLRMSLSLDIPPDASPGFQIDVNGEPGYLEPRLPAGIAGGLEWRVRLSLLVAVVSETSRQGPDGVRLKTFVRDGPRGEWGSSWRGTSTMAPMQYRTQSEGATSPTDLKSWATYLASPFLGASPVTRHELDETEADDGDDLIDEGDEGWVPVKIETVECEVPIKVWPGNTAFKALDVVFEV